MRCSLSSMPSVRRSRRRGRASRDAGRRLRRPAHARSRCKTCYVSASADGARADRRSTAPGSRRAQSSTSESTTPSSRRTGRPADGGRQRQPRRLGQRAVRRVRPAARSRSGWSSAATRRTRSSAREATALSVTSAPAAAHHERAGCASAGAGSPARRCRSTRTTCSRTSPPDRPDRQAVRRLRAVLGAPAPVPVQAPARRHLDRAVRPGAGATTRRRRLRAAEDRRDADAPAARLAETAARLPRSTRVRSKRSSPSSASTVTWSPVTNSPFSRPSASGSTSRLEMIRLSGRAP